MSFSSINPYTKNVIASHELDDSSRVDDILEMSHRAFLKWKKQPIESRCDKVLGLKKLLLDRKKDLALMITQEMGKPLAESIKEIEKCATMVQYYADNAEEFLQDVFIKTHFEKSFVTYQPQGIIFGIMPWNFPLWQVLRFTVPTLLAGNTVIVKHAPNVWGCQKLIQDLFDDLDVAEGVFQSLYIDVPMVEEVVSDHRVRGGSFTGSVGAGRKFAEVCGRYLKKCVLELGGSDAYLVLEDASLEQAVQSCVTSRFINGGQSCVAAKRWIVHKAVYDEFLEKSLKLIIDIQQGNPEELTTRLGPLARFDLKEKVAAQVEKSIAQGSHVVLGGPDHCDPKDNFYPATLLAEVKPGQVAFEEEIFGPVASLIKANSTKEAIELANRSAFGLGGAVFTADKDLGEDIARNQLDTGGVFVNDFYKSVPSLPFGGVKSSGIGRELSQFSLYEFTNLKTVVVNES
tara:strand:- start:9956 stop:11332 length:1377 start_codon:yes stop_codon:yes gene_type:complete